MRGRVTFETGPGGVTYARLTSPAATAGIALYGAQLIGFTPAGQEHDVLWLNGYCPAQGKDAWGGIPLCYPWFMMGTDSAKPRGPFHGFARKSTWAVLSCEATDQVTICRLGLQADKATRAYWPYDFSAELIVTLDQRLDLELVTRNTGAQAFELEHCFHTYFNVGDVTDATLHGLDGARRESDAAILKGPLHFNGHYAGIFTTSPGPLRIEDPVWRRRIVLKKRHSTQTVVWNSGPVREEKGRVTGEAEWRTQLAVETLCGKACAIQLEPGAVARLGSTIGVEPLD